MSRIRKTTDGKLFKCLTWDLEDESKAKAKHLLPGEKIIHQDSNIQFQYIENKSELGTLICTNFQLIFVEKKSPNYIAVAIPLGNINEIKKIGGQRSNGIYGFEIIDKLLRNYLFIYERSDEIHSRRKMAETIVKYAFPENVKDLFSFQFAKAILDENLDSKSTLKSSTLKKNNNKDENSHVKLPGWELHDSLSEIARLSLVPTNQLPKNAINIAIQRKETLKQLLKLNNKNQENNSNDDNSIDSNDEKSSNSNDEKEKKLKNGAKNGNSEEKKENSNFDNSSLRLSKINNDYSFCHGYPAHLIVPAKQSDSDLMLVGKFRSRQRIPAIVYVSTKTGALIARCSQPMVGLRGKDNKHDEALLQAIHQANCVSSNPPPIRIVDARPKVNADANRLKGGGYELKAGNALEFCDIANIHVMRDSLKQVVKACQSAKLDEYVDGQSTLAKEITSSGWLSHISKILKSANRVVKYIEKEGATVLLHCSDGWDRTAQISALAMMMMDPYYRTSEGFCVVIAKEWISFGHKFGERLGQDIDMANFKNSQRSPVFIQFIDCVWQLLQQYPNEFEFNERFLLYLRKHCTSCLYGTFLGNNDEAREQLKCAEETLSLFDLLLTFHGRIKAESPYVNNVYHPTTAILTAQPDPVDSTMPMASLWLSAYADASPNLKSEYMPSYPDSLHRVVVDANIESTLAHHHLGGVCYQRYGKALRRYMRGPTKRAPRRRTISKVEIFKSENDSARIVVKNYPTLPLKEKKPKTKPRSTRSNTLGADDDSQTSVENDH